MKSQLEVVQRGLLVPNQSRTTFGPWLTLLSNNTIHSAAPVPSPSGDLMSPDWPCWCQPIAELAPSPLVSQTPAWVSGFIEAEKCVPCSEFKWSPAWRIYSWNRTHTHTHTRTYYHSLSHTYTPIYTYSLSLRAAWCWKKKTNNAFLFSAINIAKWKKCSLFRRNESCQNVFCDCNQSVYNWHLNFTCI